MEGGASDLEVGVPISGRVIILGGYVEHIETVFTVSVDVLGIETSLRCVKLHDSRMVVRNLVLLILKDEAHMEGVTRTPHASLSIYESLETLVQDLSAHVKAAQGFLVTGCDFEVACGSTSLGDYHERLPGEGDLCHSVSPGLGISYLLELVAVDIKLGVEHRLSCDDVADADPDLVASGVFGDDSEVGCQQVDGGELVIIHVVSGLHGVVPVFPLVFIPIVE